MSSRDSGCHEVTARRLLPPVAWHNRYDPGAAQLARLTRSNAVYV